MTREEALQILRDVVAPVAEGETPNAEAFVCCIELYGCGHDGFAVYEAIETIAEEPREEKL